MRAGVTVSQKSSVTDSDTSSSSEDEWRIWVPLDTTGVSMGTTLLPRTQKIAPIIVSHNQILVTILVQSSLIVDQL
jgi:hypothetical protein